MLHVSLAGGSGLALETAGRRVRKDQGSAPGLEGLLSAGEASACLCLASLRLGGKAHPGLRAFVGFILDRPLAQSAIAHTGEKVEVGGGRRRPSPAASKWLHSAVNYQSLI